VTAGIDKPLTGPRWTLEQDKLGNGKSGEVEASQSECAAVAKALDLLDCRNLVLTYTLKAMQPAGFRMRAEVKADVVQACIITTDPVAAVVRDEADVDLLPADAAPAAGGEVTFDAMTDTDSETYSDGRIDLGHIAFEVLSTSIDPYPRKPGAELAEPGADDKSKLSPFAVLAKLKKT
jgi:hypothetical protein